MTTTLDRASYEIHPQAVPRNAWTAASIGQDTSWRFRLAAGELRDVDRLLRWAGTVADPVSCYQTHSLQLSALSAFGARVRAVLRTGTGIALVEGLDAKLSDDDLRICYLALGMATGNVLTSYGRLYDVCDRGADYRTSSAPISMTKEATSFHTDSSARDVEPEHVGLLCLTPAQRGGDSLLTSATTVHEALLRQHPTLLQRLYRDFARDVVTPGRERTLDNIRANRFPIFRFDAARGEPVMRYMRYWIERAHDLLAAPLDRDDIDALDRLDEQLAHPDHVLRLRLERGQILWMDNRTVAHNRDGYEDGHDAQRLLVRMWIGDR